MRRYGFFWLINSSKFGRQLWCAQKRLLISKTVCIMPWGHLGFLNVGVRLYIGNFQFQLEWDFFTEQLENWNFCILLTFTFCQIVGTVFQGWYICVQERGSQFVIKLSVFKKRNFHIYATNLCQFKCWEYCSQAYEILSGSLNAIYCLLDLYIDIGIRYITKMKTC